MLCHETATLRLFLCAQVSLFLFQFRTSNVSSPFPRGAKNGALEAATAIRGNPIEETDSNSDFVSRPLALDENADRKTSLEEVPTRGNIELSANTPRMLSLLVTAGLRTRSLDEQAAAPEPAPARRWWWWTPCSQRTSAMSEERLGSYSIRSTTPKEEVVFLLKSTIRCSRLAPPPL
ncbi:hypothetical protein V8G54_019980 [Vigna mungo]|uniref:Secreted protein n=1 Tax=Vigna mungo TaxID=3915 RepID=A0AAQ3RW00_VIGMU